MNNVKQLSYISRKSLISLNSRYFSSRLSGHACLLSHKYLLIIQSWPRTKAQHFIGAMRQLAGGWQWLGDGGNSAPVSPKLLRDWKFTGIGIIVRATIRANHVASHGPFRDRRSWMPMGVFVCTSERKDRSWGSRSRAVRTEAAVAVFSPVAINMPLWRNRTLNTGCEGIK